ncbi:MAG: hypothetical protein P4L46_02805 [Fimbriimonas sp.]|nr:hypothetical protein [Fimbriimonas sp.]
MSTSIERHFQVICHSVVDLPVDRAGDEDNFLRARDSRAIVVSKDSDVVDLVNRLGQARLVLWVTCGDRSNALMNELFIRVLPHAAKLLVKGEPRADMA